MPNFTITTVESDRSPVLVFDKGTGKSTRKVGIVTGLQNFWGRLESDDQKCLVNALGRAVELSTADRVEVVLFNTTKDRHKSLRSHLKANEAYDGLVFASKYSSVFFDNEFDRAILFNNIVRDNEFGLPVIPTVNIADCCVADGKLMIINYFIEAVLSIIDNKQLRLIRMPEDVPFTLVKTTKQLKRFFEALESSKTPSLDTETENLNRKNNKMLTLQLTDDNLHTWVLPGYHMESPWSEEEHLAIKKRLRKWCEHGSSSYVIGANFKYDFNVLRNYCGFDWFNHHIYDVSAGEYALDENYRDLKTDGLPHGKYGLGALENLYGYRRPKDLVVDKESRNNMAAQKLADIAKYGSIDTLSIKHICKTQQRVAKFYDDENYLRVVTRVIGRLIFMFANLEYEGVYMNLPWMIQLANRDHGPMADVIKQTKKDLLAMPDVQKAAKQLLKAKGLSNSGLFKPTLINFDPDSREHLETLFLNVLELEPVAYTETGKASIGKLFYKAYKHIPAVAKIQDWVALKKLLGAFVDALLQVVNSGGDYLIDGTIKPSYDYRFVVTGRSSSFGPSFQQLPEHGKFAKLIKKQFMARFGCTYVKPDFSAHEVRCLGNVSGDKAVCDAFNIGLQYKIRMRLAKVSQLADIMKEYVFKTDIHIQNVYRFFKVKVNKKHTLRQGIKQVVFGVVYGKGASSLGRDLKGYVRRKSEVKQELEDLKKKIKALETKRAA